MAENSTLRIVVDALTAIGTFGIAGAAIWGDWIRGVLAPPKLFIDFGSLTSEVTTIEDVDTFGRPSNARDCIYYQLVVQNRRRWMMAKNCKVVLRALWRRGPDGKFHTVPLNVPYQFVWTPGGWSSPVQNISTSWTFDFGRLEERSPHFEPVLYWKGNSYQGYVRRGECLRFGVEIVADNFAAKRLQFFEVAWDGTWTRDLAAMRSHLTIQEVSQ